MLSCFNSTLAVVRNDVKPEEIINFCLILGYLLVNHEFFEVGIVHAECFIYVIVMGHMIDQMIDMLHHVLTVLQIK